MTRLEGDWKGNNCRALLATLIVLIFSKANRIEGYEMARLLL